MTLLLHFTIFSFQLSEVASQTAGISNEVAGLLAECIWVRREEVRAQLVREASTVSHCNLEDFDWDAKVYILYINFIFPNERQIGLIRFYILH